MEGQENQPVEVFPESASKPFTWRLVNFSGLNTELTSKPFVIGGYKWHILVYPGLVSAEHFSIYMSVVDPKILPQGWSISVRFRLTLINQVDEARSVKRATKKFINFNAKMTSWGWPTFLNLRELYDNKEGFLQRDTCLIKAELVPDSNAALENSKEKLKLTSNRNWEEESNEKREESEKYKRKKTDDEEANNTQPELPILDPLLNEVQKSWAPPQTASDDFYSLLEDITRVVGATCSGSGGNESVQVSESLCLVKFVAGKSFQRIPSSFWPELTTALNVLAQATSLSSIQSSAVQELSNQFEDLCKSYSSASAVLQSTRERLESYLGNYLLLKRWRKTLSDIKGTIGGHRAEAECIEDELREIERKTREMKRQLRKVKDAEYLSRKDFTLANFEAGVVKDDWDAFIANERDRLKQDEENAENELAAIEANWASFASHFK